MDLTSAHAKMVRDLYLESEKRANRDLSDSPEYDTQKVISDFYEDWFRNTEYEVRRECAGKVDVVVFKNDDEQIYYELKTYYKSNEKIGTKEIFKDVEKLAVKIGQKPGRKAYILVAGRKKKLGNGPVFVDHHVSDNREYYDVPNQDNVFLRPSRKDVSKGQTFVLTWEVILKSS